MSKYTELMLKYSDGELGFKQASLIENKLKTNTDLRKEYVINQDVDDYMRSQLLMSEINQDPEFFQVDEMAKNDVAEFTSGNSENIGLTFYINGALAESNILSKQIDEAEREMHLRGVERETSEWVESWVERKDTLLKNDKKTREIFDFVKNGMNKDYTPEIEITKTKSFKRILFRIASSAAILIIALGFWTIFSSKTSSEELFTSYYQPYQVIDGQTRSENKDVNKQFINAVRLYKKEEFSDASKEFERLLKIDNSSLKIQLLFSITQIEQKNYNKAIIGLENIISTNGEFTIEAKWYLALCYLKTKQVKEAKLLLNELSETPGYFKNKSANLLDEL